MKWHPVYFEPVTNLLYEVRYRSDSKKAYIMYPHQYMSAALKNPSDIGKLREKMLGISNHQNVK